MFEIEKGIPIPAVQRRAAGSSKYPFASLEVGDSFFVAATPSEGESQNEASDRVFNSLSGSKYRAKKHLNRDFTARVVDGGVRVWRTA